MTLEAIAAQVPVDEARFVHFTHISIDKPREVVSLARLINSLNRRSEFAEFRLSPFSHPAEGYPEPSNGHIDMLMRPSLFNDRPSVLFQNALNLFGESELGLADSYIRVAMDDDDVWLPWAIEEFVTQGTAALAEPGRSVRCIGISKQFLYYPLEDGRVDLVDMTKVMPGSKFLVSADWSQIKDRHPWMLPESFSENVARQMRHRGVDIRLAVGGVRPCLIYVRRHGRLSAMTKFEHYRREAKTVVGVGSEAWALESALKLFESCGAAERGRVSFELDPPTPEARATLTENGELRVTLNSAELVSSYELETDSLRVRIKCATEGEDSVWEFPFDDQFMVDPSNWTGRSVLTIVDEEDHEVFGTWIRGEEKYLS